MNPSRSSPWNGGQMAKGIVSCNLPSQFGTSEAASTRRFLREGLARPIAGCQSQGDEAVVALPVERITM